jgi:dipeptidyl aminopeptidase/acylaminoacyl peptidase
MSITRKFYRLLFLPIALGAALATTTAAAPGQGDPMSPDRVLSYPYADHLVSAHNGGHVAWVRNVAGVRNIWVADGPSYKARQVTNYTADEGQELTYLTFSPNGSHLVYVRGGDHDANWPAEGNLAPDPAASTEQPKPTIWEVPLQGGQPVKLAEGDAPVLSDNALAYVADDQVWTTALDGKGKPERLFFDRGKDRELQWSPDGKRLTFISNRGDHAFIGVFSGKDKPLLYLAPATSIDSNPRWSPDGKRIAFVRQAGRGGAPKPVLVQTPDPFSIWIADANSGAAKQIWQSPNTLLGSIADNEGGPNLAWGGNDRLFFVALLDNYEHLYSVAANGGQPLLLTPGPFMVEHIAQAPDGKSAVYSADTGTTPNDGERRHIFRVPVDAAKPVAITSGQGNEWRAQVIDGGHIAFIGAGIGVPPAAQIANANGSGRHSIIPNDVPANYPSASFVVPQAVMFKAVDGTTIHGQLFQRAGGGAKPGVIFVHGGPPRQMLLGWHYMDYYSNAYAVNQMLAAHGFVVLSVNYRLGIGYTASFNHPPHAGPAGAAEYQDVVAGAKFLQHVPGVDPKRIGMWGGSYGGYLTAMALARNSDIFKAGVDFHGVHDWSVYGDALFGAKAQRYEQGDREQAMKVAFQSSPDFYVAKWRSPVLLIHGDDDRNVMFEQTIDLANRLTERGVPFEEMVIPNEIHGFLRHASWLKADKATIEFLTRKLGATP